jgi:hypothetical protein
VDYYVAGDFESGWFDEAVAADVEDFAVVESLLAEDLFRFAGGVLLDGRFWH